MRRLRAPFPFRFQPDVNGEKAPLKGCLAKPNVRCRSERTVNGEKKAFDRQISPDAKRRVAAAKCFRPFGAVSCDALAKMVIKIKQRAASQGLP